MERIISRPHHHYRILISALIALAFLGVMIFMSHRVSAESSVPASDEHIITLHDDGIDKGFITKKSTLRDALKDEGIRLDTNDRTEPGLDEKLVASSYQVNIYRARPVVIRDGSAETKILTSYRTGKQIATQAKISLNDADKVSLDPSRDPIADGAAEVMTITRATRFTFIFYGKTETSYTLARTVGDMLKEKNITMGLADGISPSVSTPIVAGMTVKLWRDGTQTVTVEEDVVFTTKQIKDADHEKGYKGVQTKGENGRRTVTYEINTQNGVEVSRKEINSNVTKQAVEQVEVIGVKGMYTTPTENEVITWNFLIGKGLSREQAAGIMGNLKQEHGFNTSGDGLAQWTGSRKAKLLAMADPYTIQTQLDFLWYELSGPYAKVLASIRQQTRVEDAVVVFQNQYEKCGYCVEDRRISFAYDILASH